VLNVTFYGVRGSTPCSGEETRRYGGNTSCVALESPGRDPILLDLGTGARYFGHRQPRDRPFRATALVTHLHWDHVQGLPFFPPLLRAGAPPAELTLYAPPPEEGTVAEAFDMLVGPPFFPVTVRDFAGAITFEACHDQVLHIDDAEVLVRPVPHLGATNGYRITWQGTTVTYISDHQQPLDGSMRVDPAVVELAEGSDLLIHDAQFTPAEFAYRRTWGHCTMDYALRVAEAAGARRLALYHHDPGRHDDALDALDGCFRASAERSGIEVLVAAEGLTVSFDRAGTRRP